MFTREGSLKDIPACYYCVVNATNSNIKEIENIEGLSNPDIRKWAYWKTLAREKFNLNKSSNFVNGSPVLDS